MYRLTPTAFRLIPKQRRCLPGLFQPLATGTKKAHVKGQILYMGLFVGSRNRQVFSFAPIFAIGYAEKDNDDRTTVNVAYTISGENYFKSMTDAS
jgi:hypothetical protein